MMRLTFAGLLFLLPVVVCMEQGSTGKKFLADLAGTFLKALFPEIKQSPNILTDISPVSTRRDLLKPNIRDTKLLAGSSAPDSSFFRGSPQIASPLSTGSKQWNSHDTIRGGIKGRTDLPSSYVYPFAKEGSMVIADHQKGSSFLLTQDRNKPFFSDQAGNLVSRRGVNRPSVNSKPDLLPAFIQDVHPENAIYDSLNYNYEELSHFDKSLKLGDLNLSPESLHAYLEAKAQRALKEFNQKRKSTTTKTTTISSTNPSTTTTPIITTTTTSTYAPTTTTTSPPKTTTAPRVHIEYIHTNEHQISHKPSKTPNHDVQHRENILHNPFPRAFRYRILDDPTLRRFMSDELCSECQPADLDLISGSWTQIYGDIEALKSTFSNLASLRDLSSENSYINTTLLHTLKPVDPLCVGIHIKPEVDASPFEKETQMLLYFRDGKSEQYHELTGYAKENSGSFIFELPHFIMPMCLVKSGPVRNSKGDYLIMSDTRGPNKCNSYHVFVRNPAVFARLHARKVIQFLQQKINESNARELMSLPNPQYCQSHQP